MSWPLPAVPPVRCNGLSVPPVGAVHWSVPDRVHRRWYHRHSTEQHLRNLQPHRGLCHVSWRSDHVPVLVGEQKRTEEELTLLRWVPGLWDFSISCPRRIFPFLLSSGLLCFFVLLYLCCFHVQVLWTTLVHEFHICHKYTEWNLLLCSPVFNFDTSGECN